MLTQVEVEDGVIPEGKELVRIGRRIAKGDQFLSYPCGQLLTAEYDFDAMRSVMIVRDKWEWPEWIRAPYIAMDSDGDWYFFASKPIATKTQWLHEISNIEGRLLWSSGESDSWNFTSFTPPPCTDWRQSLRRNPNAKDAT